MASSSVSGAGGCGFESHPGRLFVVSIAKVVFVRDALVTGGFKSFLQSRTLHLSRTSDLASDFKCDTLFFSTALTTMKTTFLVRRVISKQHCAVESAFIQTSRF